MFDRKRANTLAFILGLFFFVFILIFLEWAVRLLWKDGLRPKTHYEANYRFTDPFDVTKPFPNGRYPSSLRSKKTGALIYDVVYSIDSYSRRVTPVTNPESRNKFLLFFGCSFMYGEGVQDNETIPYYAAAEAEQYTPYNYAFHGHGPAQMLAEMESMTLSQEIREKEGILIYLFIDYHIHRTIGSMRIVGSSQSPRPYYILNREGEIVRKGNFTTGRPLLTQFYKIMAKSQFLKLLGIDLPRWVTDKHVYLTARVIQQAYRLYKQQFPKGEFYVTVYPGSKYGGRLIHFLKEMNIKYLDYSNLFDPTTGRYFLSWEDKHPNALAHRIVAYRQRHGRFRTLEELEQVEGIGPKTSEALEDYVRVH